jgi:AcrR family transcriptional regulator
VANQDAGPGRTNQKARTREALLASAVRLIRSGRRPTVEEAALAAGISKRTAYRYFTSQDHMLADAALESTRALMDDLLGATAEVGDVYARVAALARAMNRLSETHEAELRVMMRAALDRSADTGGAAAEPARGRRRLHWIETALAPIRDRLDDARYRRLVNGLAVCLGVDAMMVLRDVSGVTGPAAAEIMIWSATALVDRALSDAAEA